MLEPANNDELPPIPGKRYFTIGEVSDLCGVKPHVLRYWEQEFPQLKPVKRRGNRRYYQRQDVLIIRQIRSLLYDEGFTIGGARQRLTGDEARSDTSQSQQIIRQVRADNTFSFHAIRWGKAEVMISGGTEAAITPMGMGGFISARALSLRNDAPHKASRPFDKERDGFVMAEGAGVVILEELEHARKRGANIYAELIGTASTADAHHITAPHPCGAGASKAMEMALRDARLGPADVQYINAHGTSTEQGDVAETRAIKQVFGEHAKKLAVSSTKSMLGHLLGASGGVELIATVLTIQHRVIHPTINLETHDPTCDLDYIPNEARRAEVRTAVSNSFGFGGHNASIVLRRFED